MLLALRSLYTASLGVTQPGGAGTTIYLYDDLLSASGSTYTPAEIATLFPADFQELGTGNQAYRSLVDIQIGDTTTGAAQTTLTGVDCSISFDVNKVLRMRTTQTSSWRLFLGEKVGSGDVATGKRGVSLFFRATATASVVWRGTQKLYGCTFISNRTGATTQALQMVNQVVDASEVVNCIVGGFSGYVFGTTGLNVGNVYNLDITGDSAGSNITSFFISRAQRLTVGGNPAAAHIATATPGLTHKEMSFFGTPTVSDMRWNSAAALNWVLIRPVWSLNVPKISGGGPTTAADGAQEYRTFLVKVVDATGAGVASIPVKLTDAFSNVLVNTTTDANGEITHGAGLTTDVVAVADYYNDGAANMLIRHRSPFLLQVNATAGLNPAYLSKTINFNWPGMEGVTPTAGAFGDVDDIVAIEEPSVPGSPTLWTEFELGVWPP
jgi:hypothetical protein